MFSPITPPCYKPCFVSWCPMEDHSNLLAVGTYDKANSGVEMERLGAIELYEFDELSSMLHHSKTLETGAGVFRLKWIVYEGSCHLMAALTNGSIFCWCLQTENVSTLELCSDAMLLCFSVTASCCSLIASDSRGRVHTCDLRLSPAGARLTVRDTWTAHQLPYTDEPTEVWAVAAVDGEHVLISGADDSLLKVWDRRLSPARAQTTNRVHRGGVTSLLTDTHHTTPTSLHHNCNSAAGDSFLPFLTGSYDECVRQFDLRNIGAKTEPIAELSLGGGVWHMEYANGDNAKACATTGRLVVASCMYNGWAAFTDGGGKLTPVVASVAQGEHLLYGASVRKGGLAAFCTFNNRTIFLENVVAPAGV